MICAAGGDVVAGAFGLALACDFVLAKESVTFGCPEINVGVFPFMISALIYRNVGRLKANELMMCGESITAAEALELGLVNRVIPDGEFDAAVQEWARQLASKSPLLMRLGKDAINNTRDMSLPDALTALQSQLALAFTTEDIVEGSPPFAKSVLPYGPCDESGTGSCLILRSNHYIVRANTGCYSLFTSALRGRLPMAFASVTDRYSDEQIREFYATGQWHRDTFFDLLEAQVTERGDRIFLTDDTSGGITFRQLRDKALCLAVGLRRHGVTTGDRVSVQVPNWIEFAVISVALSRLGAILVPIMPIYRRADVEYILNNAGVRLAMTPQHFKKFDYAGMYTELLDAVDSLEDVAVVRGNGELPNGSVSFESLSVEVSPEEATAELGPGVGPDEPFVIVYSSGTTSRPKGCIHTFNTMACGSRLLAKGFAYTPDDVQFGPRRSPIPPVWSRASSSLSCMARRRISSRCGTRFVGWSRSRNVGAPSL